MWVGVGPRDRTSTGIYFALLWGARVGIDSTPLHAQVSAQALASRAGTAPGHCPKRTHSTAVLPGTGRKQTHGLEVVFLEHCCALPLEQE